MTEQEAAQALRASIARRRAQAREDQQLDTALLVGQLDGAGYVLDCLGAPAFEDGNLLTVDQRIAVLQRGR